MEYITIKQAAEKWGVSERYARRVCTEGRIEGAIKIGGTWAVPKDAEISADVYTEEELAEMEETEETEESEEPEEKAPKPPIRVVMPLLNTAYKPGVVMDSVNSIEDAGTRAIALGEYYYFSGQSDKASDTVEEYLTNRDIALRLSACLLYSYANLALDRISRTRQALSQIRETAESLSADTPPIYRAYTVFVTACANVLLHLPMPESPETMRKYVHMLPAGLRLFALYAEAHQAYLNGSYGAAIGISETALAIEGELYPIPAIYLHLVAAMGYINLKQTDTAREHLMEAWEIAKPDEMIEAFGEHHGLLGGLIEAVFKKDYPDDFRRIINITYSFSAGWRKIHNPDTGHYVADDLTTTEFTVAMLAARGWTNKEIGAHIDISANTVKMHISTALQKLGITQRKDLAQFMLK